MKKVIALVMLCLALVVWCPSTKAQWEGAEIQRLTYNSLRNKVIRLYVDEQDKLHLFYLEGVRDTATGSVYGNRIVYRTRELGGSWSQPEEIGYFPPDITYNIHLVYDTKTGIIHMLYSTFAGDSYDDTLYYTNSIMPNWQVVKIDSLPGQQNHAWYNSYCMVIDSLGNVHVVWHLDFYSASYNWYRVIYANNSTGEWVKQQVSEPIWLNHSKSGLSHLTVQKNGTAHIVYHGEPCDSDCVLYYARNDSLNSTNWITDTVPKPTRLLWHYWVSHIKVDVSNRVHLLTVGCIEYDCFWPDKKRTFYYYKQAEDSIWQGEEQIPDTALGERLSYDGRLFIDREGIPYVSYIASDLQVYFTDRNQGCWKVPYLLVNWREDPDSVAAEDFYFVLDSQGKGHSAFYGANMWHAANYDSVEIYYFSSSSSDVDTEEDYKTLHFDLSQNYPNPFNSSTIITYEIVQKGTVTLKIYDLLGREVRELVNRYQVPTRYEVRWDGKNNQGNEVASGIYFYLLRAGERKEGKKMLLIK